MPRKSRRRDRDALVIVAREHQQLRQLLREHARLRRLDGHVPRDRQAVIVDAICLAVSVHAQWVSEWLYPALRRVARLRGDKTPAAAALPPAQAIVARLDEMQPDDTGYDDALDQLQPCVLAHLDEVQDDIDRGLLDGSLDTAALGRQIAQRLRELRGDITRVGMPPADADRPTWPHACRLAVH